MIRLLPTDEIDEAYLLELMEYRKEWVLMMNALASESLNEEEVVNITLLVLFYCSTMPPLQQFKNSDLTTGITEVLNFLCNLIDYSMSICGELSDSANEKIEEYDSVIRYIDNRLSSIVSLENLYNKS